MYVDNGKNVGCTSAINTCSLSTNMEHDYLLKLRQHPTWRLLCVDNAPLIISFFYRTFIQSNSRSLKQSEITEKLDDVLFHLRQIHKDKYPKSALMWLYNRPLNLVKCWKN